MKRTREILRTIIEANRIFFTVSCTILSCGAAWAGYSARLRHQKKLEEKLGEIGLTIDKYRKEAPLYHPKNIPQITLLLMTGVVSGYIIGRVHARQLYHKNTEKIIKMRVMTASQSLKSMQP